MPLYEYECPECGERIEVLQKTGEDGAALKCQKCKVAGLRKVLSGCVVKTKGSGTACALGGNSGASGFT